MSTYVCTGRNLADSSLRYPYQEGEHSYYSKGSLGILFLIVSAALLATYGVWYVPRSDIDS